MIDNEIIKALECCPLDDIGECLKTNALFSRINRLKVEIERLKAENEEQHQAIINVLRRMGEIRSETVKEFASKLTPRLLKELDEQGLMPSAYVKKAHAYTEIELFINEIAKEMTEDEGK